MIDYLVSNLFTFRLCALWVPSDYLPSFMEAYIAIIDYATTFHDESLYQDTGSHPRLELDL